MQVHLWGAAFIVGLQETRGTQAPAVPIVQPDKAVLWPWCAEVIANVFRKREEFCRHDGTNRVAALIGGTSIASPVAVIAGDWIHRTFEQRAPKDVK